MDFAYTARSAAGEKTRGTIAAESIAAARSLLRRERLFVTAIAPSTTAATAATTKVGRLGHRDLVQFTNQLAVMVDAGVPVSAALDSLSAESGRSRVGAMASALQSDVEGGESLSTAMAKHPRTFNATYCNLVRASEATGSLGEVMQRLATQLEQEREVFQQVRSALTYPACMIAGAIGVGIFLLAFVFPQILPLFKGRDLELPLPTKVMMFASDLITTRAPLLAGLAAVAVGGLILGYRHPTGRRVLDAAMLKLPVFGPLLTKLSLARTLRTLALTTHAGVPILEALELTSSVARNVHYRQLWADASTTISGGTSLQRSLEDTPLVPLSLARMIGAGEQTGRLSTVLVRISDGMETDLKHAIKTATGTLEPMMIGLMGGMIGTIALGILLPVFKLSTSGLN